MASRVLCKKFTDKRPLTPQNFQKGLMGCSVRLKARSYCSTANKAMLQVKKSATSIIKDVEFQTSSPNIAQWVGSCLVLKPFGQHLLGSLGENKKIPKFRGDFKHLKTWCFKPILSAKDFLLPKRQANELARVCRDWFSFCSLTAKVMLWCGKPEWAINSKAAWQEEGWSQSKPFTATKMKLQPKARTTYCLIPSDITSTAATVISKIGCQRVLW